MTGDQGKYEDSFSREAFEYWEAKEYRFATVLKFAQAFEPSETALDLPTEKIRSWASAKALQRAHEHTNKTAGLYQPIRDDYEIRVLEIKPGSRDDDLQVSLKHCSLEFATTDRLVYPFTPYNEHYDRSYGLTMSGLATPVEYTALSYTWGPPVFDTPIHCDGHKKCITSSLASALRHFRQQDRSVVMWVDQICTDQDNKEEKARQIPLMTSIYQCAMNTVIWLGEAGPGSDAALRLLEDIVPLFQFVEQDIGPDKFHEKGLPEPGDKVWKAVLELLSRPWFTRLWVIQELNLSRKAYVVCGDNYTTWDKFDLGCNRLIESSISHWLQHLDAGPRLSKDNSGDLCKLAVNTRTDIRSLYSLLVATRNAQCWDKRDKVYGLLGLCAIEQKEAIQVSYDDSYTPDKLFHDVALYLLQSDSWGIPPYLLLASVDHGRDASMDLPSWVPDWSRPRVSTSLKYETSTSNVYSFSGIWPTDCTSRLGVDPKDRMKLRGPGIFVDTISQLSDVFANPDISYSSVSPGQQQLDNPTLTAAREFVWNLERVSAYPRDQIFPAFRHTLVAGQDASGREKVPASFAEIFSLLLDATTGESPSLPGQTYTARQRQVREERRLKPANLKHRQPGAAFQDIRKVLGRVLTQRKLGITKRGYLGLFPRESQKGDAVYVLDPGQTTNEYAIPFVLRPVNGQEEVFQVVGESYLHGIMFGETVSPPLGDTKQVVLV